MAVTGVLAQNQPGGDLLIVESVCRKAQDLALPIGEPTARLPCSHFRARLQFPQHFGRPLPLPSCSEGG